MSNFVMFLAAMTAYFSLSGTQMAAAEDAVRVEDGYARVAGPSAKSAAVFLTLHNASMENDTLLSVSTDAAVRAELHTHSQNESGVMHMGEVEEGFPIAGMETRLLDRGGDHIMLLGLKKPLAEGDSVTLTLTFERSGAMTITVPVDNDHAAAAPHNMDGMEMMEHEDHLPAATD